MQRPLDSNLLVLGWAGSTERQLRGIATIHRSLGSRPTVVAPRVFRAMALPWGWRREGDALAARLIEAVRQEPAPWIVHAFSNAGFWTWAATLRALMRRPDGALVLEHVAALVLDSAPGFPAKLEPSFTARYAAMAMMPSLLGALGRPPALTHPRLDGPLRAFMRLWYYASPGQIRELEDSLRVVRDTGSWPILALCSSADTLVPIEHVEAFVASAGERASALRWEDSEHVRHLIVHRHEYVEAIRELVRRAVPAR